MTISARALGWYHVLGALAGAGLTVWAASRGAALVTGTLWAAALPFALSLVAGRMLLTGHPRGRTVAYAVQALQIPIVILPVATWRFVAGLSAAVTFTAQGTGLFAGVEAAWLVGSGGTGQFPPTLGLNVAPIVVMVLLRRMTNPLPGPAGAPAESRPAA